MIDHEPHSTRSGTLHFLISATREDGIDCPVGTLGGFPLESAFLDFARNIERTRGRDSHHTLECRVGLLVGTVECHLERSARSHTPLTGNKLARTVFGSDFRDLRRASLCHCSCRPAGPGAQPRSQCGRACPSSGLTGRVYRWPRCSLPRR